MANTLIGVRYGKTLSETWDQEKKRRVFSHGGTYVIQMDSDTADEADVDLVAGCPQIGDASGVVTGAVCTERSFDEIAPHIWEVEATYETVFKGEPSEAWGDSFEWSWSFETVDEPLLWDAQNDATAIQNSAGEALPPVSVPIAIPVLTIARYESTFSGSTVQTYTNKVNDAAFWGATAGQVLCSGVSAEPITIDGVDLWKVTYVFKFKTDTHGWKLRLLDQGTYYWTGAVDSSEKRPFATDDGGTPVIGNLDGSGGKNTTGTPSFVSFNRFDEATFPSSLDDPTAP